MNDISSRGLQLKTKIWIENDEQQLLFGKGKTEILELIEQLGSIAGAAEQLGMNYRKAWKHIQILQNHIDDQLVVTTKGSGGGTSLTPNALELVRKYRQLQAEVETFADQRFTELFLTGK